MEFNDYYPKVENLGIDFLKDSRIIRNLIFAIQQVTIMQVCLTAMKDQKVQELVKKNTLIFFKKTFLDVKQFSQ